MGQPFPRIGLGVLVFREGKILLGKRRGSHGAGYWAAPGGHLEFNETPEQCARRELEEETGLIADTLRFGPWTNDLFPKEQKHYVTLFAIANNPWGEAQRREPEKCDGWAWFPLDALPTPLFTALENLLSQHGSAILPPLALDL